MLPDPVQKLVAENKKLQKALSRLLCWAGCSPDGPSWATPAARARNREMFEQAVRDANECLPEGVTPPDEDGATPDSTAAFN